MLNVQNLHAQVEEKEILKGLDLTVAPGEVHAIMGPNGAGKSTFAKLLAGHPDLEATEGSVEFFSEDLLDLDPEERVHKGLFMSFQYPIEIAGVTNFDLLFSAKNSKLKSLNLPTLSKDEFRVELLRLAKGLKIPEDFVDRAVNCGFSGGEKKRNEILQMAVLDPKLSILDETDSGLDIDALKIVAEGVNQQKSPEKSVILITHYQRLLTYIKPDFVHVMMDGKIVKSSDATLALELEAKGYDWLLEEVGV